MRRLAPLVEGTCFGLSLWLKDANFQLKYYQLNHIRWRAMANPNALEKI